MSTEFPTESLAAWLDERLGASGASLEVERHHGGISNETYFVTRGAARWVLRRPPRGPLPPRAHDVLREARVIAALGGTPARVPPVVLTCDDTGVIGAPFYLMERHDGEIFAGAPPEAWRTPEILAALGDALIDALVEIHAVDYRAVGLEDFGRPHGYLPRQLERWVGTAELTMKRTRHIPEFAEIARWLQDHLPESPPATVVHGDYRMGNVIYTEKTPPQIEAVLDWELSTIGDPLADVGYLLSHWSDPGESPLELPGMRTRDELVERYERLSGRSMGAIPFYLALAVWKLAIILEGRYASFVEGKADAPGLARLEQHVLVLARRALAITRPD